MATTLPTKIIVGKRHYKVSLKNKRAKAGKDRVFLFPEGEPAFEANWPMRLHSETNYQEFYE